ncbi:hypothetical protein FHT03_003011 [Xanthomonas arboricola]
MAHQQPSLSLDLLGSLSPSEEPIYSAGDSQDWRGLYSTFEFVLRLSQPIHQRLAALPSGISAAQHSFEDVEAMSVFLHETVHWWQHVGSTYGLLLSMTYPAEAHANHNGLKALSAMVGRKKPIRQLTELLDGPSNPETALGIANIVVNNQFDFDAFRRLTFNQRAREAVVQDPFFESVGHTFGITYGNVIHLLANTADPTYQVIPEPKILSAVIAELRRLKVDGYYFNSPVAVFPIGAREIMEGQARFAQIQYLHFASGKRLSWDALREIGMLDGMYGLAFEFFLTQAGLGWPNEVDDPIVALFLLICDMAINPGAGFPLPLQYPEAFISDVDPGARFTHLAAGVRLFCPEVATTIRAYSFDEYEEVSEKLAKALKFDSPLTIARTVAAWSENSEGFATLRREWTTFAFKDGDLPIRVMLAHFQAFMADKAKRAEFFCWPGAWMAGERVSPEIEALFDRHGALFVDKPGDTGVYPRVLPGRDQAIVHATFEKFFGSVSVYYLTRQWITSPGPFRYSLNWLVEQASEDDMKTFASGNFASVYGFPPETVEILGEEDRH